MSVYNERIKNFEKIRAYMREFYVYGFKSREEYDKKSARSYDDDRRRLESWLGEHMRFVRTPEGKNVFISIDSRVSSHNPLYAAWKAKSFTDGDITLHFILLDILHDPAEARPLSDITERIDDYLAAFEQPMTFDESTVRKKLKEYVREGLLVSEKQGRSTYYHRAADTALPADTMGLHFFSEVAPCGVIGSFLLDKYGDYAARVGFKHHYMTAATDSHVLCALFSAMREERTVTVCNLARGKREARKITVVPLHIRISVQDGRQYLLAYHLEQGRFASFRLDYLSDVCAGEVHPAFGELRKRALAMSRHMWGASCTSQEGAHQQVAFTVEVGEDEAHIWQRLLREKRCGKVEKVDATHYRFSAEVHDANELIPWIRTFICRITDLHFSDPQVEARFRKDLRAMYRIYEVGESG